MTDTPQDETKRWTPGHRIAAAPDLADALVSLRGWVRYWRADVESGLKPTLLTLDAAEAEINAALARARGEQ